MINISRFLGTFYDWVNALLHFWDILNSSISSFMDPLVFAHPSAFLPAVSFLKFIGVYDYTLIEFMVGAGIAIYIGYQLIVWVLNLIT